jgi:hypothetical protein
MKHRKVCVKNKALAEFFTYLESIYGRLLPSYQDTDIVVISFAFCSCIINEFEKKYLCYSISGWEVALKIFFKYKTIVTINNVSVLSFITDGRFNIYVYACTI